MSHIEKPVVIALDYANESDMLSFVDQIDPAMCRLKVGKEMFTHFGPNVVKTLADRNFDVFLDLKFHDIPNTVAKAVAAAAELGVWMVNVHAQGGSKMMEAARKELETFGNEKPLLIAVTILTSMSEEDLKGLGYTETPEQLVAKLAKLAHQSGLDGVVSSSKEASMIKDLCGKNFVTVTPGIRPKGSSTDDQKRVLTPEEAVHKGADYLVIGRPITKHENPLEQLKAINKSLGL